MGPWAGRRAVSPARRVPSGSYRVEDDVVKAGGRGCCLGPRAAPLRQPAPDGQSQQDEDDEHEEGTADRGRHGCGQCCVPCGPRGA